MMVLTMNHPRKLQEEIHIDIGTPRDEFYNINTTQYGPPMSARHKLQPRLPRPNQGPSTFPKTQTKQKWIGPIYLSGCIYKPRGPR